MHLQQTKAGSRATGGPQYWFEGVPEHIRGHLQRKKACPVILMTPYGPVETVRIMTDRDTGRARGFGFVEMPDNRAAQSAIEALNGTHVDGRALTVNEARPREPRREPRQPRW